MLCLVAWTSRICLLIPPAEWNQLDDASLVRNSTTQSYISPGDGNDTVLTPSEFVSIQFLYTGSYSIGPLARNFLLLFFAIHHHQHPPRTNWTIWNRAI